LRSTHAEPVVAAASSYFHVTGFTYGLMAVSTVLFSAYQGWGRATAPLLVSLLRLAIILIGGWMLLRQPSARLDLLYILVAGSTVTAALILGIVFVLRPPNRRSRVLSS
jgi:Na+-driven multidrug efflux pump